MSIILTDGTSLPPNNEDISEFEEYLIQIKSNDIRDFVREWLRHMPSYIFHAPASSSGKYHPACELGEGGLKRHLLNVTQAVITLSDAMPSFSQRDKDCAIAAAMLHDMLKSGWSDDYEKDTHTKFDHPRLAAEAVLNTETPYICEEDKEYIASGIITHMGKWNKDKYTNEPNLPTPQTEFQKLIHTADFIASRKNITIHRKTDNETENAVKTALDAYNAEKPNGEVIDADTILADIAENADMRINGIGKELLENWLNSNSDERNAIEKTFYLLYGEKFKKYAETCATKTTPPKE